MPISRRDLLKAAALAGAGGFTRFGRAGEVDRAALGFPDPSRQRRGDSSVSAALRAARPTSAIAPGLDAVDPEQPGARLPAVALLRRFPHLRRHFVLEYYPWYETNPFQHWDEAGRHPPDDIASNYMPALGPYDSRAVAVMEQHARWIAETGIGAINVSWWGPGSGSDRIVPLLMDVMRAHDIHVTFHLEPYADDRSPRYGRDILYLLENYGVRRRWDAFLLLERADGTVGPVLKSFRTILPPVVRDCHDVEYSVPDYTPDGDWRRETDRLRRDLLFDFDHLTLLADSLDVRRTREAGFDGIAIYDNYVEPATWSRHAAACARQDLLFSFNVNPGFHGIALRQVEPDSCYRPPAFEPRGVPIDWANRDDRETASRLSLFRARESFDTTVALQSDSRLTNARRGFFLTYVNSFNEWHEGHQFEPMKNAADLSSAERARYHNPERGDARLTNLTMLLDGLLTASERHERLR